MNRNPAPPQQLTIFPAPCPYIRNNNLREPMARTSAHHTTNTKKCKYRAHTNNCSICRNCSTKASQLFDPPQPHHGRQPTDSAVSAKPVIPANHSLLPTRYSSNPTRSSPNPFKELEEPHIPRNRMPLGPND